VEESVAQASPEVQVSVTSIFLTMMEGSRMCINYNRRRPATRFPLAGRRLLSHYLTWNVDQANAPAAVLAPGRDPRISGKTVAWRWRLGGGAAKAKTAYEDFFSLWKDRDPGIPIIPARSPLRTMPLSECHPR
jgi:hypothetical protein